MTSHYDLKQQEKKKKKNGVFGAWLGGSQIFLSYILGVEYFFPTGLGGGSSDFLTTT